MFRITSVGLQTIGFFYLTVLLSITIRHEDKLLTPLPFEPARFNLITVGPTEGLKRVLGSNRGLPSSYQPEQLTLVATKECKEQR